MLKYLNSVLPKISKKSANYGKGSKTSTVFIDLDGTLVKHQYCEFHKVIILDGVINRLKHMQVSGVYLVLTTGRRKKDCKYALREFRKHDIIFDQCVFDLPTCRRILINDDKYPGQPKAAAFSYPRDKGISEFIYY